MQQMGQLMEFTSTDIGVAESGSTLATSSLGLTGNWNSIF